MAVWRRVMGAVRQLVKRDAAWAGTLKAPRKGELQRRSEPRISSATTIAARTPSKNPLNIT